MNLVYLSPVPWASFAQRSHKFVDWFMSRNKDGQVLWVEPYATRLPGLKDIKRPTDVPKNSATKIPARLSVIKPRVLPIEPLPGSSLVNSLFWNGVAEQASRLLSNGPTMLGVAKPSALSLVLLRDHRYAFSFYDAMDDFPAFYAGLSRSSMAKNEYKVAESVKQVFCSSTELMKRWESLHPLLIHNASDLSLLPSISNLGSRENSLVYIGTIGEWFDWEMVISIAEARPKTAITLIGPIFKSPPTTLPPNVLLQPPCEHAEAMKALKNFRTGLIPFKKTRLTQSVDPVKYYEYRGMGLSVISSSFGEMRYRGAESGVFLLDLEAEYSSSADRIGAIVDAALSYQSADKAILDFRTNNSWEERFGATHLFS